MRRETLGNIATALFFAALAVFFLVGFLEGFDWPLRGRATSIGFSVLSAGLACRVIWGMRHGE
jgi:hypothetical protein